MTVIPNVSTPGLPPPPDPPKARPTRPIPEGIAAVLILVRILLAYGQHLSATLEHRATARSFSAIAQFFGTARVPVILSRLSRGILRATALERVLLARAARGRDLVISQPRRSAPPQKAEDQQPPRPARRRAPEQLPDSPTLEQLQAHIRRRPIGHTIADICRDLGISPTLCEGTLWTALYEAITWYRGSFHRYYRDIRKRQVAYADEWDRDRTHAFDWPDQTRDGVRRALGFFIGEPGVSPVPPTLQPALADPTGPP